MNTYLWIVIACGFGAALLALLAIKQQKKSLGGRSLRSGSGTAYLIFLYTVLIRYRFSRSILYYIRKRLEFYTHFDELAVRKKTVVVFLVTATFSLLRCFCSG